MQLTPSANPIGFRFIELQSVDSTNKYAMSLVHAGMAQHGVTIFAHEQSDGRGQMGKKWLSEKGSNIALSIIINPALLSVSEQFKLSVCAAVSVFEFFLTYTGDETKIKWPNDLYWRDRKAGGMLIENVVGGDKELGVRNSELALSNKQTSMNIWKWAVAGIGININQTIFPEDLPNPVSLKQITGKNFEPIELAKQLCSVFDKNLQLLVAGKFSTLFSIYQNNLYKKDEKVKLKKDNRIFEVTIQGVSETGQLIIQHSIEERFDFGEVEWVMSYEL